MLFRFETSALILSPYEYVLNSCALLFWNSECLCIRESKFTALWQQKCKSIFKPWERCHTILYSYTVPSPDFTKNSARNLGQSDLCYCVKTLFHSFFTDFSKGLGTFAVKRARRGWLEAWKFLSWKFLSFNIAQTTFYQAVKKLKQMGEEKNGFCRVPRKKFSKILSFSKNFCQQFLSFHVHLFFRRRKFNL